MLCKELPYVVSDAKQWKKDARKLISTEKKVVTLQEKYDLWREKYATLSKNNKKREAWYLQTNRTLRKDLSVQKQQKELFRGLYWLFFKKVGPQRTPLYELSTTKNIQSLYDNLAFSKESATVSVWPIDMQISEVEAWYDFYFEGKLPESHGENEYIVDYVRNWVRKTKTLFWSLFQ